MTCDRVHWTFFTQKDHLLAKVRPAFEHLNSLQLRISTCHEDNDGVEVTGCANLSSRTRVLQSGSLRNLVTTAPDLKNLDIGSHPVYGHLPPICLTNAVGTHHWQYLERASFSYLSTLEEVLLGFCDRHAKNLTDLSIIGLTLTSGCWQRVFQRIRKALRLKSVEVSGWLMSYDPEDEHNLDDVWEDAERVETKKPRIRVAIEAYLLEDGDSEPMNLDPALYGLYDDDNTATGRL